MSFYQADSDKDIDNIKIRTMVELLKMELSLQKVAVQYYSKDLLKERLEKHAQFIFLSVMAESERDRYRKMSEESRKKYKVKRPEIYLPDISVGNLIEIYRDGMAGEYDDLRTRIDGISTQVDIPFKMKVIMHFFLHEVGHWYQLSGFNWNAYDYMSMDEELEKNNAEQYALVMRQIQTYCERNYNTSRLVIPDKLIMKLKQINQEYRRIPKERFADEYASKILSSLTDQQVSNMLIKKHGKSCETTAKIATL